jgi:acyl carrier protein
MSSYEYIKQLLVEKHDVKPEVISPDAKLAELGLDSLSIAELMFDVSDKYGIDIPDERATFTTLGEGAALVDALVSLELADVLADVASSSPASDWFRRMAATSIACLSACMRGNPRSARFAVDPRNPTSMFCLRRSSSILLG